MKSHTIFALPRVTLDHLVTSLKAGEGHVSNRVLLVVCLRRGDDGRKGGKREVNTRETMQSCEIDSIRLHSYNLRHQVRLKFIQIDVKRAIEPEGRSNRGNNLGDQTVQIREPWRSDIESLLADVVDSFIINLQSHLGTLRSNYGVYVRTYHEGTIRVLQSCVCR